MDLQNMSTTQIMKTMDLCDLDYTSKFNSDLESKIGTIYDDGINTIDLYWSYELSVMDGISGDIDIEPLPNFSHKFDPLDKNNMNYSGMFEDKGYEVWSIGKLATSFNQYDYIDFYASKKIEKSDGLKKLNQLLNDMKNPSLNDFYIVVFNSYIFPEYIGSSKISDKDENEMKILESFIASELFDTIDDFTDESYWTELFKDYTNDFWNLGFFIVHRLDGKSITISRKK